jgi:hypothetical protein
MLSARNTMGCHKGREKMSNWNLLTLSSLVSSSVSQYWNGYVYHRELCEDCCQAPGPVFESRSSFKLTHYYHLDPLQVSTAMRHLGWLPIMVHSLNKNSSTRSKRCGKYWYRPCRFITEMVRSRLEMENACIWDLHTDIYTYTYTYKHTMHT